MPAPIIPAPRMPTLPTGLFSTPAGRSWPLLMACRSKKKAWIIAVDSRPAASSVRYRDSIRLAVSKSTCEPSTAADMTARGDFVGAPLSCLRRLAGKAGRFWANFGTLGVPPGIL